MDSKYTYQCFFVDRFNWLRTGFIGLSAGTMAWREKGKTLARPLPGAEQKVALEAVAKGSSDENIARAVRAAAEAATDFSWLSKGDRVLLKPASNSGEKYPATTNPVGVRVMAELLREKGAGKVLVSDMAGIEHVRLTPQTLCGSTRELMKRNGLAQAAEAGGAELYFPEEHGWDDFFEDFPAPGSNWRNGIFVPKILKEVDHIVLLPRVSRHPLAGATLGIKAAVGYLRFDSRLEYHRDAGSYYEKHTEINSIPSLAKKLRLVLSVAGKVQTTFGPDQGFVVEPDTGLVLASESLVAHDMTAMAWLLKNRGLTPQFQKSGARDPYATNSAVISLLNRGLVLLLGGPGHVFRTPKLQKFDLENIWNDPTLHRAFQLFGGAPKIKLIDAQNPPPENLSKSLASIIALP